jgi:hypothetical protein
MSLTLDELLMLARFRANKEREKLARSVMTASRRDDLVAGLLELRRAGVITSILWNDDRLSIVKKGDYDPTPIQITTAEKLVELFRADRVAVMPPASEMKILERKKRR